MSVTEKPKNEDEWIVARHAHFVEKQLPCFYCYKPLQDYPVVGWDGRGPDGKLLEVVMHPACANKLVLQLAGRCKSPLSRLLPSSPSDLLAAISLGVHHGDGSETASTTSTLCHPCPALAGAGASLLRGAGTSAGRGRL